MKQQILETLEKNGLAILDDFLSPEDCSAILDELEFAYWERSAVTRQYQDGGHFLQRDKMRVSQSAIQTFFSRTLQTRINRTSRKLRDLFQFDVHCLEPWQATSYKTGGRFDYHLDCGSWKMDPAGERKRTYLIYLDTPEKGGSTHFRALDVEVKAFAGRMLVWNNLLSNGNCNHAMIHASRPVIKGRKNTLVTWQREKQFLHI